MLETALFLILASGLWWLRQHWQKQTKPLLPSSEGIEANVSVIAYAGLYRLDSPQTKNPNAAFRDLRLLDTGLILSDNQSLQDYFFEFAAIQWVSPIQAKAEAIASISIHLEISQRWRILSLELPELEMAFLARLLSRTVSPARLSIGRKQQVIGTLKAYIAEDNWQGESNLGAEVSLYLLPHLLVVLQDDRVKAKLDLSSIRRVLAVEKVSNRLDKFLNPKQAEGILRLYSLYETAAFALPQFRELAEEISFLARCPIEFISQVDKEDK